MRETNSRDGDPDSDWPRNQEGGGPWNEVLSALGLIGAVLLIILVLSFAGR
jgi:hypothetical protein